MKKYKLIKKYPGSPELGYIALGISIPITTNDEYSEFWEEVIEKDYEILSLKATLENGYHSSSHIEKVSPNYQHIEHKGWNIHSIKRLSDGEIFTIGDLIKGFKADEHPFIIKHITLSSDTNISLSNYDIKRENCGKDKRSTTLFYNGTHFAEKVKKPLFTTEDGVDVFEGDDYYHTTPKFKINHGKADNSGACGNLIGQKGYYYFSTKEIAKEYILLHKPCLSLKDIFNTIYINSVNTKNIKKLEELAKSRL